VEQYRPRDGVNVLILRHGIVWLRILRVLIGMPHSSIWGRLIPPLGKRAKIFSQGLSLRDLRFLLA
jgi:hypothetical protein